MKQPTLSSVKFIYAQDPDCCGSYETQILEIETADGGGGHYVTISTDRWALDDEEDVAKFADMILAALKQHKKEVYP